MGEDLVMNTKHFAILGILVMQTLFAAAYANAECTLASDMNDLKNNFNSTLTILHNTNSNRQAAQIVLAQYLDAALNKFQAQQQNCSKDLVAQAEYAFTQAGEFVSRATQN